MPDEAGYIASQCGHEPTNERTHDTERMTNQAYAYDRIADEDVPIECSNAHQKTDFDHIDGDSLPVMIESDFRHDPVEGCQGSFTEIIEIEDGCPNCGYDRADKAVHTLAGVHRERCRACDADITDREREEWTPTAPTDPITKIRESGEYIAKTSRDGISVYRRNERLFSLVDKQQERHFSLNREELLDLLLIILNTHDDEEEPLSQTDGAHFLRTIIDLIETDEDEDDD